MRNWEITLLILVFTGFISCTVDGSPDKMVRKTEKFTSDWKFMAGDHTGAELPGFDDSSWQILDLPHDWSITEPYSQDNPGGHGTSFMIGGIGWYRKTFTIPEEDAEKRIEITFDGVYQNSTVWVNGHKLGTRPYGYITFKYKLSPFLVPGSSNVIAVRVDNSNQPNSRWYSGSGIYRNVWLTKTDKLHIDPWGLFITTPKVNGNEATVKIGSVILNGNGQADGFELLTEIFDPKGKRVGQTKSIVKLHEQTRYEASQEIILNKPLLWAIKSPNLYTVRLTILQDNKKVDDYQSTFGIRTFHFDPDKGFFLNNEPLKIKGVCMHHDLGALGASVNVRAMERQLNILQGMGVNAIRTAHNPPAPELLKLCDRIGFLVMNETFDEWKMSKTRHGYSVFWDEWHEQDLRDHILRDRNHPSVIMWSIGNEILEQWHPQGTEMAIKLASIVKEIDPTRPITAGNNEPTPGNSLIKSGMLDLIGYNYKHESFKNFPEMFPGQSFIGAETTSALATRGHYDMPSDSIRRWPYRWDLKFTDGNDDNTCSAYDHCSTPWGSTHAESWKEIKKHDFLSGMFIWTGFDYLGEPTPYGWPSRSSYFGVVDLAGFPKDAYYMYKSEWTDETVLHVFPHWNWEVGQTIDVVAYYNNATEVELFLNNVSLGVKSKQGDDLSVMWRLPFEEGTLKAVSRINGMEVKNREITTAGKPARMQVAADRTRIAAGGDDISFISIDILDDKGILVPYASNLISISINGDAAIAGVDNGNQTSHHNFKGNTINAFHGKCLAIIRAGKSVGTVKVTFESEGLPAESLVLTVY